MSEGTTANFEPNLTAISSTSSPMTRRCRWIGWVIGRRMKDDWAEAERCFCKAYDLEGGDYGYCLGIALKQLGRFEESLPLLLEQAHTVQPDAMSWFQVASSYHSLGRWPEAVESYEKALALDPHYAVAMFDLGGAHWNSGNAATAAKVWRAAI